VAFGCFRRWALRLVIGAPGCLIDSTRELLGTVFGLSAIFVILRRPYGLQAIPVTLRLVRRPSGLHPIPAILRLVRRPYGLHAIPAILRLVRRPYGLHATRKPKDR
jgi:hypothetical protein